MARLVALLLATVVACAGCTPSGGALPSGQLVPVAHRMLAPPMNGVALDGTTLDVRALKGKVVVLNFWASWCADCRAEAGALNEVFTDTRKLGVAFVGIDIKDDRVAALGMQRSKDVLYPSIQDQQGMILLGFRGEAPPSPPSTFVLDRHGRVAIRFLSQVQAQQLTSAVETVAAESA